MEKTFVISAIGDGILVNQSVAADLDGAHEAAFNLYREHKDDHPDDGYVAVNCFQGGTFERVLQIDMDEEIELDDLFVYGRT